MFRFLVRLIKLVFLFLLLTIAYAAVSDEFLGTYYFEEALNYVQYLKYLGFVIIGYGVILVFSWIELLFKKSKVVKSSSKNGRVEVNLDTVNDLTKVFLESKNVIKAAKVISYASFSKIVIKANLETYNIDKLNERLDVIQNELKDYIKLMTGVPVRQVTMKISKINQEKIFEEDIMEEKPFEKVSEEEIIENTPEF